MASWKDARSLAAALFVAAAVAGSHAPRALAGEAADKKAAHEAYERGARAFGQGSYSVAATEFARADELQPAPAALEAALKAAILAEDPVLAMTLVDRAATRPSNDAVAAQVARARDRFAHKVGRLTIQCADPCSAKVGNEPVPTGASRYYLAGNYVIEITARGSSELYAVQLPGGASMEWKPPTAAPPPPVSGTAAATALPTASPTLAPTASSTATAGPVKSPSRSLSPVWFGVGVGVTVVSGSLALGFGINTLARHDAFVKAPTEEDSAAGQDAQLRTNIFIGVTAATAVATAILGYLAFRKSPVVTAPQAASLPGGLALPGLPFAAPPARTAVARGPRP